MPKPSAGKPSKKKTVEEQVSELLRKLSHNDLKQFVLEQCIGNPSFRQIFISGFAYLVSEESKEMYKKQIRSFIASVEGEWGYINWSGAEVVIKAVESLLSTAQKHLDQGRYQSTIYIACAVMEEMTPQLEYVDDSDGSFGGLINQAFELLNQVAQAEIPDNLRLELLGYCLTTFGKNIYEDWDWHLGMLDLASRIVKTESEGNKVIALIDKPMDSDYTKERAQLIKWEILLKMKGTEKAEEFINQNLANSRLRTIAIESAIRNKKYEKAIGIAQDGVRFDAKDKPGLVYTWYDWLLKIAAIQKDTDRIIEYARILFVDSNHHGQEYYKLLKAKVAPDRWKEFVEAIIADFQRESGGSNFDQISGIYINEKWWDRLFALLKTKPSLHNIEAFDKYLAAGYSNELVEMYSTGIVYLLKRSTNRDHYQEACRYLRRMIKLGAREQCDELIRKIRVEYPRRSALLDELNRV
ncbi:MAG: hypothetical protein D4R64_03925 [Porphyromonadaceae bacterium]|nr:MAG: hypothetical protein D4R64_03925 [Porphyromonadaceae bacterium]